MTRDRALMQGLRARLSKLVSWMQKSTYASEVRFEETANGEFRIVVSWVNKDGSGGSYAHPFTRDYVFGPTFKLSVQAWSVHKCATEFARDVIREVLARRLV